MTLAIPVIIVGFKNPDDICDALRALSRSDEQLLFDVYICENGGRDAFAELVQVGLKSGLLIEASDHLPPPGHDFAKVHAFELSASSAKVFVGEARDNLGYGGGINSWLKPLSAFQWPGAFILNPDAAPAVGAIAALKQYAEENQKGMVTGRILLADEPRKIQTRGLRFQPWRMVTEAVGKYAPIDERPNIPELERILDSPSGAAFYITRDCFDYIGFMREDYFLYYEDLDWGRKAKKFNGIGYAFDAIIFHKGGTTIGSGGKRSGSPLSAYLEFRNRLLFVWREMPGWIVWGVFVSILRALEFLVYRRMDKTNAALLGIRDALLGRDGRPRELLYRHLSASDRRH